MTTRRPPLHLAAFLAVHAVVIAAGFGWAAYAYIEIERPAPLPEPQDEPLFVGPLYDDPAVVSDEQLRSTLWKLRPRLRSAKPKINFVDHALRFWGLRATFPTDSQCYSGEEMLGLLTNHRRFAAPDAWGPDTKPFLAITEHGVRYRTQSGPATASHVDHTLGTFAEIGLPLSYPLDTADGEARVRGLFDAMRYHFSLNQREFEWTATVLALYCPTSEPWTTTEGQRIDFNVLAERMIREPPTEGVCYGNHRLYSLALLLRIDETHDILSDDGRAMVVAHLKSITAKLIATQNEEGWWDGNWDDLTADVENDIPARSRRLLATGHALEWWAIAPAEVHPPRKVVVKAGQWVVTTIADMDENAIFNSFYPFLTHVGRALALWRHRQPAEVQLP